MIVYIEEAHPSDGWAFTKEEHPVAVKKPKTIEDRLKAANMLETDSDKYSITVDKFDDEANKAYGGLFERLYIIQDGVVLYEGGVGPWFYNISEVREFLQRYQN